MKIGDKWTNGWRLLRRSIEIPEKINGYSVQGARVTLDLVLYCNGTAQITTYSNGPLVFRGTDDQQVPLPLPESAQPRQQFLISVRVDLPDASERLLHDDRPPIAPQSTPPAPPL